MADTRHLTPRSEAYLEDWLGELWPIPLEVAQGGLETPLDPGRVPIIYEITCVRIIS